MILYNIALPAADLAPLMAWIEDLSVVKKIGGTSANSLLNYKIDPT